MKEFDYREITEPVEQGGIVVKRDLMLRIDKRDYLLSIATPKFIDNLREYNKPIEEELQIDDNILPMDSVSDLDEVVDKLSQMKLEEVAPYLVEQEVTAS